MYALCLLAFGLLDSPVAIVAVRGVTGVAFGGLCIGSVLVVSGMLPPRLQATGQGLFQIMSFGLSAVIANAAGGILYAGVGPTAFFGGAACLALAGAGLALLVLPEQAARLAPEEALAPGA